MRKADGTATLDSAEKSNIFADYYAALCVSLEVLSREVEGFLEKLEIPQLTQEDQEKIDAPIQPAEIVKALICLKLNKVSSKEGWIDSLILQEIPRPTGKSNAAVIFGVYKSQ